MIPYPGKTRKECPEKKKTTERVFWHSDCHTYRDMRIKGCQDDESLTE